MSQASEDLMAKVFLLALIEALPGTAPEEIKALACDSLYFDYFSVASAFDELIRSSFISCSQRKNERRKDAQGQLVLSSDLTPDGLSVLRTLREQLPRQLTRYLEESCRKTRVNREKTALYRPGGDGGFILELSAEDSGKPIIRIELMVPQEKTARLFCQSWQRHAGDIYLKFLESLEEGSGGKESPSPLPESRPENGKPQSRGIAVD